ncbi:hypothetical protein [Bacillus sp. B1-b2]|uniref:hypothetical protein n=1 Tax=Bacillus sp. B1-b2 TaxID=2653201 RepID=UPI00126283B8|nr:hypothetical protein [Bacillus sp. B1-b2]KAB7671123.1 hypothetical protein F9279_06300 [Bacillus sp. B1-b2]
MSTMYEKIIEVLEKQGPTNLVNLYEELNRQCKDRDHQESTIAMSSIKSVLSRKKDLFHVNEDIVSINPEKEIKKLIIEYRKNSYQTFSIHIDFFRESYVIQEWSLRRIVSPPVFKNVQPEQYKLLKRDLYRLKVWDWEKENIIDAAFIIHLQTLNSTYTYKSHELETDKWKQMKKILSIFTDLDRLNSI